METIYTEFRCSSAERMKCDFQCGEHFRTHEGGYTNRWLLKPGEYRILCKSTNAQCVVKLTAFDHMLPLNGLENAGLGMADDPEIVEFDFQLFCALVDLRWMYADREKLTPTILKTMILERELL